MSPRRILHYDIDAFFTQCAAAAWPDTAGRAELLIVGGSADSRGVVTSASYKAREFGVRAGMPTSMARRLCPRALFVPVPRDVVGQKSRAVVAAIEARCPLVAPSGVDEGYVDLSGTEALPGYADAGTFARALRAAVHDDTGMTISVAIAPNMLVAKVAVDFAKPGKGGDGVIVIAPGAEGEFMRRLTLGDLPGIGPVFAERLARLGLKTVRDVVPLDLPTLTMMLGANTARWLHDRARGIHEAPVVRDRVQKAMSREDTFPQDLHDDAAIERELLRLVERVAADLRGDGLRARTVTVKIKDADFVQRQAGRTLSEAVETDGAILRVARDLLRQLRRARRVGARLVGGTLSQFEGLDRPHQLTLFDDDAEAATEPLETERDRRLARTVDTIRERFGRKAIERADLTG